MFRFVKPDLPPGYYWCDGTRLTKIHHNYKGAAKPRDVRPEDWPAKDGPKQRELLEAYAEYERLEREALALRNFPRIAPDVAIPAMVTDDGTRVTGKLAMEELAKPPWLREAYVSFEGNSDEAEVTSFQEYHMEFGFAAPAMPREPAKDLHLRSGCFTTIEEMKWAMGYVCLPMEPK